MRLALALTLALTTVGYTFKATSTYAESDYPSHLVRLVVPYPAGSQTDIDARIVAEGLAAKWGQTVIVDNVEGAGGTIGTNQVAHAKPDGYTLLVIPPAFVINNIIYKSKEADAANCTPVSEIATVAYLLDARLSFPGSTAKDLIDDAKAHPDTVTYASGGVGSSAQLAALRIEQLTGVKMVHVPFRGAAPALADVMAGHVDIVFDALTTSLPYWKSGMVKVLGIASNRRSPEMPDVPTIEESGLPGFELQSWAAMVAPPGTPAAVVGKISRDISALLEQPQAAEKLHALKADIVGSSPEETARFLANETSVWGKIVQDAKISVE